MPDQSSRYPAMHLGGSSYEAPPRQPPLPPAPASPPAPPSAAIPPAVARPAAVPPPLLVAKAVRVEDDAPAPLLVAVARPVVESPSAVVASPRAELTDAAPGLPRGRQPNRRVRDLMSQLATRRNEVLDLIRGPFSASGWGVSLFVHAALLTGLAFLIITPSQREKPRILTVGQMDDGFGVGGVGDSIGDLDVSSILASSVNFEAAPSPLAGGSMGDSPQLDLSSVLGSSGISGGVGSIGGGLGRGSGRGVGDGIGDAIAGRVKAAGGKGGSLQISLAWNDTNDLDLHVVTPSRDRIYYARTTSEDGGTLDVDMNVNGESKQPVENVTWGTNVPGNGQYLVQVQFYAKHGPAQSPFNVRLQVGEEVHVLSGVAETGRFTLVATFDIQDGRCTAINTKLREGNADQAPVANVDTKRQANRERAARAALIEAISTADPELKIGRLRGVVRRFSGTVAAAEAQERVNELTTTN